MMSRKPWILIVSALLIDATSCGTTPKPAPSHATALGKAKKTQKTLPRTDVVLALPKGWTQRDDGPRVIIEGPDPKLQIVILATGESSLKSAITEAWTQMKPAFAAPPKETITPPTARAPFSASMITTYDIGKDEIVHQAIAHRYGKLTYVLLLSGPLAEVKKRSAQARVILGSVRPKGAKEPTVTAKDARTPTAKDLDALKQFVSQARTTLKVPGVEVALVQDGKVLLSFAEGYRDIAKKKHKVTPQTPMMVGSITKSFTAMMIAKLVAAGKLTWKTPVTTLDKTFQLKKPEQTKIVQLQHLLCACTGVPRRDLPLLFAWEKKTPKDVLHDLKDLEFLTDFGETFQYSNQLVAAAGFIAAKKLGSGRGLGRRYGRLLKKTILGPLGMRHSTIDMRKILRQKRYAHPHSESLRGQIVPIDIKGEGFVTPYAPAGALWSTAEDFSKLLVALTAKTPSKALPPRAQLAELWRPRVKATANMTYGLGFMTRQFKGTEVHCHGGATLGFRAYFAYIPAARAAYVILTNGTRGGALLGLVANKIETGLFGQKDESDKTLAFVKKRIDDQHKKIALDFGDAVPTKRLAELVGTYDGGELGVLRIANKKGRAILDTGAFKMAFVPRKKGPKKEMYMIADPPLTGIPFWVETKEGKPELNFELHTAHFTATKK